VFRREADYLQVSFQDMTIRLRDTRGMRYLATLLHHPGHEFAAAELAGGQATGATVRAADEGVRISRSLDDGAGSALDMRAEAAYRRRLRDLEAATLADGDATPGRAEAEALRAELARGERNDRSGTHSERARLTVTKGIGSVLERIATEHPALGTHLQATVRRGYFCVYVPDSRQPIRWES
jgi:non-specific serine/threonine protein kinase